MEKICAICARPFVPSKYRAERQQICSDPVCQHKRQLDNMKRWRKTNPHYFKFDELKGAYWRDAYKRRMRRWRKEHPEYFRGYRQRYKDRHRDYMREYMRRYRGTKRRRLMEMQAQPLQENAQPLQQENTQPPQGNNAQQAPI